MRVESKMWRLLMLSLVLLNSATEGQDDFSRFSSDDRSVIRTLKEINQLRALEKFKYLKALRDRKLLRSLRDVRLIQHLQAEATRRSCPSGYRQLYNQCLPDRIRRRPKVNKNVYLYKAPNLNYQEKPQLSIPKRKVHYNYVFIKTPNIKGAIRPLVIPPTKQKTLVYVLSENPSTVEQEVIEVAPNLSEPEVFYVNYDEGDNPILPGGIDLESALSKSADLSTGTNFRDSDGYGVNELEDYHLFDS